MKIANNKTTIVAMALFVFLNGSNTSNAQAISKAKSISEKKAMIERFFGKGKKLDAEGKKRWRKVAFYGDCSAKHDFGVHLAREGELEEAKKWFRKSWNYGNGCLGSFRRLRQVEQIEELEKYKKK